MPQMNIFHWPDGQGWLVLSGGGESSSAETGHIEAEVLARVKAGDPVAYIWAAGDIETADEHLTALYDLGAPTGYLVDILTEDDDSLRTQLKDVGLIVLGDGPDVKSLRSALPGVALDTMVQAFTEGTVILGIGSGAAVLGAMISAPTGTQAGFSWLEQSIIMPDYNTDGKTDELRLMLDQHPDLYGLGINKGSALALGPDGQVETWGNKQVTIALGRAFNKTS